jgi:hypothetical protein
VFRRRLAHLGEYERGHPARVIREAADRGSLVASGEWRRGGGEVELCRDSVCRGYGAVPTWSIAAMTTTDTRRQSRHLVTVYPSKRICFRLLISREVGDAPVVVEPMCRDPLLVINDHVAVDVT